MIDSQTMSHTRKQKPIKLLRKRLNDAEVEAHFASIAGDAEAIEVRVKDGAADYSSATAAELAGTCRELLAGAIVAVQIRFCQDGAWWCDTVMRARDSYRLVRMRQS